MIKIKYKIRTEEERQNLKEAKKENEEINFNGELCIRKYEQHGRVVLYSKENPKRTYSLPLENYNAIRAKIC